MNFLYSYSLFLIKIVTMTILMIVIIKICFLARKQSKFNKTKLKIRFLNKEMLSTKSRILDFQKKYNLINKKDTQKSQYSLYQWFKNVLSFKRCQNITIKPNLFILKFKGDIAANQVSMLKKEITAIILVAKKNDEVLLKLESSGGIVNGYGLAASQLKRLRNNGIYLTIAIDKIAASGGYMMASVANCIIASPFAIVGSIGVIGQLPNFYRLLKNNNIDIEQHTAGKFKRNLTIFGKNTEENRQNFYKELEITHDLFKAFVHTMRPNLNIDLVSQGNYWFGTNAIIMGLIDIIQTSDDFILLKMKDFNLLKIEYSNKTTMYKYFFNRTVYNFFSKILKFGLNGY